MYEWPTGHIDWGKTDNIYVDKVKLRRVFAANLERAMRGSAGLKTQTALAKATGVTQGYLSELMRCESSPTTDMLATLAAALQVQPWELLADDEATREAALRKILMGSHVNEGGAGSAKEVGKRRKKDEGGNYPPIDRV